MTSPLEKFTQAETQPAAAEITVTTSEAQVAEQQAKFDAARASQENKPFESEDS